MIFTVDRIEGNVVVLESEDGDMINVPAESLPPCRSGDVLCEADGVYEVDTVETQRRREEIKALHQKLRQKFRK